MLIGASLLGRPRSAKQRRLASRLETGTRSCILEVSAHDDGRSAVSVDCGGPPGECDTCRVPSAGLVGRSESWLSQVERGIRSVDRLSVLLDMAKILHVDVESLIGRPWQLAPNGAAVAQGLDAVRQVMTRYDHLLGADAPTMPPLPELCAQVASLHQDYQAARYETVIRGLPDRDCCVGG